jgi:hypothetical protein
VTRSASTISSEKTVLRASDTSSSLSVTASTPSESGVAIGAQSSGVGAGAVRSSGGSQSGLPAYGTALIVIFVVLCVGVVLVVLVVRLRRRAAAQRAQAAVDAEFVSAHELATMERFSSGRDGYDSVVIDHNVGRSVLTLTDDGAQHEEAPTTTDFVKGADRRSLARKQHIADAVAPAVVSVPHDTRQIAEMIESGKQPLVIPALVLTPRDLSTSQHGKRSHKKKQQHSKSPRVHYSRSPRTDQHESPRQQSPRTSPRAHDAQQHSPRSAQHSP